jgi:hypothetical protein
LASMGGTGGITGSSMLPILARRPPLAEDRRKTGA